MIERQDYVELWRQHFSPFYNQVGFQYQDLAKRVCALRELFEETNLLFAVKNEKEKTEEPTLDTYNNKYKANFIEFCKNTGVRPDVSNLYGFQRIGSPIGFSPTNDTQFYLYFSDNETKGDSQIKMNQDEFIDFQWLSPDEALDLYNKNELPLFPPQVFLITYLQFLASQYTTLRQQAASMQSNLLNYITNKMLLFNFSTLDEKETRKLIKQVFDKSDLRSDQDKVKDMQISTNQGLITDIGVMQKLTQAKTEDELYELCKPLQMGVWYGDFHSPNDGYPFSMESSQRRRMWYNSKFQVLKVEMSKSIIEQSITGKQIYNPKL